MVVEVLSSSGEGYVSAFECSLGSSGEFDPLMCLPNLLTLEQQEVKREYYRSFPECLKNLDAYRNGCDALKGYGCKITDWPDYAILKSQCEEIPTLLEPCKKFQKVSRGPQHVFGEKELAEYSYNRSQGAEIAGSYVWVPGSEEAELMIFMQRPKLLYIQQLKKSVAFHSSHVVCLASTNDAPKEKQCEVYWGDAKGTLVMEGGLVQKGHKQRLYKRTLVDAEGRFFTQLHIDYWFDHDCKPDLDVLLEAFKLVEELECKTPLHIHCAAGINRTGAFAVLYKIWKLLKRNPAATINLPLIIFTLQWQRQYACYSALKWFHELIPQMAENIKANQP
ncbi:MAG: hypothetical protein H7A40_01410 [Chlamydiales bacterium]|nr:hypothetical protein [Chlamydiales bacterium]